MVDGKNPKISLNIEEDLNFEIFSSQKDEKSKKTTLF
jgi:hypothetical protein